MVVALYKLQTIQFLKRKNVTAVGLAVMTVGLLACRWQLEYFILENNFQLISRNGIKI